MGKLLPVLLALAGLGAGVGAGLMLPAAPAPDAAAPTEACAPSETEVAPPPPDGSREYVKLAQQFVVPVLDGDRVGAMVVLSLSLEVVPGAREAVFEREPKLRDTLLQVLFDHANMGGFGADFTGAANLDLLRRSLAEAARQIMPDRITDVLIVDMARQDV